MRLEFILHQNVQNDLEWTVQKLIQMVVWTRIDQCVSDDNKTSTFENVSVLTGPKTRALKGDFHCRVIFYMR